MTRTLSPFPIFPIMSTFVRCINNGLDFPANIHVLERLLKSGVDAYQAYGLAWPILVLLSRPPDGP